VALGGNAMTAADGSAAPGDQIAAVTQAAGHIAALVAAGHEVLLTHGNGPQVGNLLVKNELAASVVPPVPLDWCGAQTQGTIGFILLNALDRALADAGSPCRPAAVVSRMLVDRDDPGFSRPTKPIGRYLPAGEARTMIDHGQTWEDRDERGWRRVVASPEPLEMLDAPAVRALLEAGFLAIAGGGGGIPVVREADGRLRGVEAVIDKDLGAVVLARAVTAEALVIATDVEHAVVGWGTPDARPLGRVTVSELRAYFKEGHFASGSMGPKVDAACRFVEGGGRTAVITSLARIGEALDGTAGTIVEND
ncbi:MAG: carbamate kinase, partial [Actinomycetota bacterium]